MDGRVYQQHVGRCLTIGPQQAVDRIGAQRAQKLAQAWHTPQAFLAIYGVQSRAEAALALDDWWARVQRCGPREFRGLYHFVGHRREDVPNYFTCRVTNGSGEGKNNRIKEIIRTGYGYRTVANLTQRILLPNFSRPAAGEGYLPHLLT